MKACLALFILQLSLSAAEKPNLIVIMTDDMGYADVGFNGCKDIPTPHIDCIAANGVKFTSGYVAYPVCGPSRAAFVTGRYGQRFGFERNPQYRTQDENMGLPFSEETIANVLGKVGYHSGVIGKWHLGATKKHHPLNRGFREFYGHLGGGHQYFPKELTIKDSYAAENESQSYRTWILRNHEPVAPRKYLTTEFSDEAVSFIERNSAKPFFLFLSYNAPHAPLQAPGEYLKRFPHIEEKQRKIYAAMVSAVDDGVGRVLKTLREKEIEKDTIVVFLSDNGGPTTKNGSNNAPLRGGKGDAWEGGWRVPFAIQWPGGLLKGKTYSHPVVSLDIMATIVALTKAPVAKERPLDGVNLVPFLTGKKKGPPHQGIFLRKFDSESTAVRSGERKLVTYDNKGYTGLFDLTEDISESKNIRDQTPEDVARLKSLWKDWNKSNIDPVFKGLIHTPAWQKKRDQAARKKAEAEKK
ncbi:MAG: sulfatase-like hydrolase/transferase [Akkermansiaceae bacterium]|nr:sulfatase-like hydrolase/transferase [Akkermansiaceae bacterium]